MDFKIEKESVPAVETVYEGSQEQSAELDYVLPSMEEQKKMQDPAGYFVFPKTEEGEAIREDSH